MAKTDDSSQKFVWDSHGRDKIVKIIEMSNIANLLEMSKIADFAWNEQNSKFYLKWAK